MDIRIEKIQCNKCAETHDIELDFDLLNDNQKKGIEPIFTDFICPNVYLMYRAVNYAFDLTVNSFKGNISEEQVNPLREGFKVAWGSENFDAKLERFIDLDFAYLAMPEEYHKLLQPIVSSYCCGYFYPAMTSACALGERILNRLVLRLRDYYKTSKHYKKIYKKQSFDQWDLPIEALKDWNVITEEVAELFLRLKQYRNDSIHYNEGYDFEHNSHDAIKILVQIIDSQFNYMKRKDLFWLFDVPGEIWLRSDKINEPFVKEFIVPHCVLCGPDCEPMATPPIKTSIFPLKPFSDEEFIVKRNSIKTNRSVQ